MIDGHIHIEAQPYEIETITNMVNVAIEKGIDELYILDHTHKFKEFEFLYTSLQGKLSIDFYEKKRLKQVSISNYISFISQVKSRKWPIKLHFGLQTAIILTVADFLLHLFQKARLSQQRPFFLARLSNRICIILC